jgi:hypothetical protein
MVAIDTVYTSALNPGAGPAVTAPALGDSLTIRNFSFGQSAARIEHAFRRGATAGFARIRSPRMHDNATGINWNSSEVGDSLVLPHEASQPVYPADTLITEISGGAAETDALSFIVYYDDLPGISAQLKSPGDIVGNIRNMKHFQVAAPAGANAWTDTVMTTTENQLHADADYAVLGYRCSAQAALVAVKAPETGNLRVGGPANTLGIETADWFLRWSRLTGKPCIPVFNANNRQGVFVGAVDVAAVAGLVVTLVCAELVQRVTSTV